MNRRKFFRFLGIGAAVAVVAPYADTVMGPACVAPPAVPAAYSTYVMGKEAIIGSYYNYANFSDFAISAALDDTIQDVATELSYRVGLSVQQLAAV